MLYPKISDDRKMYFAEAFFIAKIKLKNPPNPKSVAGISTLNSPLNIWMIAGHRNIGSSIQYSLPFERYNSFRINHAPNIYTPPKECIRSLATGMSPILYAGTINNSIGKAERFL